MKPRAVFQPARCPAAITAILAGLAGCVQAEQALPIMSTVTLPAPIAVPTMQGEVQTHAGSGPAEGLVTVRSEPLYQNLGWEPLVGTLLEAAEHERALVYQALGEPLPADIPAPAEVAVAGTTGLRWQVSGGTTTFVGTGFHCAGHRVELTSYGADATLVAAVHQASLDGAKCTDAASSPVE